jgi:hypothetical protein
MNKNKGLSFIWGTTKELMYEEEFFSQAACEVEVLAWFPQYQAWVSSCAVFIKDMESRCSFLVL